MGVITKRYIRKPLYVDAVRVTAQNFDEIVTWCQGEVEADEIPGTDTSKKYIKVRVHNPKNVRQTKAFVGDWLLYTERGYKVYTNKAFRAAFDQVVEPSKVEMPVVDLDSSDEEIAAKEEPERATAEQIREGLPHAQDRRTQVLEEIEPHEVSAVAEEPSQETGVQPIQEVRPGADLGSTPQREEIEVLEATPEAIADAVNEQQPSDPVEEFESSDSVTGQSLEKTPIAPQPEPVSEQATQEAAAAGKYVLSAKEQQDLGPEGVRELISSGEAVLEQDLAESA